MKIMNRLKEVRRSLKKGFTLIELAIVGLFLGLLAVFAISQFSGSATDTTKANGLYEAAQKVGDNWGLAAQSCGVSTDITALNLTTGAVTSASAGNLSLLMGNTTAFATYTSCITQSGIRPLAGMSAGGAGSEKIQNYPVTLGTATVNGRTAVTISFVGVPDTVLIPLFNKYSSFLGASTASAAQASDTTDPIVRYSALASGTRTVTLVRAL